MRLRKLTVVIVALMLLAGCSNTEERETKQINENIMILANNAILEEQYSETTEKKADYTNTIKILRNEAEYSENAYEREISKKLADMLENDDLEGVKALYVELGGILKDE